MRAYWERKRRDTQDRARYDQVVGALVDEMSVRQRLSVPEAVMDRDEQQKDVDVLASAQVVVRDGARIAFFHEAFFDYAFARRWVASGQSLLEFLLAEDQELFRRAQVRQVLTHMRDDEPDRFAREAETLIRHEHVRFHIKDVVIAVLRALPNPTQQEWRLMDRLITSDLSIAPRLADALRTPAWFDRLDHEGVLERWLNGSAAEQRRALPVMIEGSRSDPAQVAKLLTPHVGADQFPNWFRWW